MTDTTLLVKPTISFVVAMANNRVIGRDNELPWHLPADLAHFKRLTLGKPVVMGRRVYDSIGRPLPGRHNIVLSRDPNLRIEGCTVVNTPENAIAAAGAVAEIAVIGGEQIYRLFLSRVDIIHLTVVDADIPGDTFFPELSAREWRSEETGRHPADDRNAYPLTFLTMARRA